MRAALLALAMLALPAATFAGLPTLDKDVAQLSHEAVAPYMHQAALNLPAGIRPGAWLQLGGADCTASFVVRDAAGNLYITTAGHCAGAPGQRIKYTSDALIASQAPPQEFGSLVVAWPQGLDAALIRIDADKYGQVSPRMIGWGGPTGLVTSEPPTGTLTRHYGWGWWTWMDHTSRCRSGLLETGDLGGWSPTTAWYVGAVGNGDSGSAVITADGKALGILDWGGAGTGVPLLGPGIFMEGGVQRFDRVLAALNAVTGLDLELVTGGPVNQACEPELPVG